VAGGSSAASAKVSVSVTNALYRCVNLGGRFSVKAAMPSV
jgi:hypothetical protein